jgi:hypothetical protein
MYKIHWESVTGKVGCSDHALTLEMALSFVDHMNKKYPEIKHWVQEVNLT